MSACWSVSAGSGWAALVVNATIWPSADSDGASAPCCSSGRVIVPPSTSVRAPVSRRLTYTWELLSVVSGERLVAVELKATVEPSADRAADSPPVAALIPSTVREATVRSPVRRFFTNTSGYPSVSSGLRLSAAETNATVCPSAEIDGRSLIALPLTPAAVCEASCTWPVERSLTNTSTTVSVSPGSRFVAIEANAT